MSDYPNEVIKFNNSNNIDLVEIDFNGSGRTMSNIKGVKCKAADLLKHFKDVSKTNPKSVENYVVPCKAKAGPKATHEYPVFCYATVSNGTIEDLLRLPITVVNQIMSYFECELTGVSLTGYDDVPTIGDLTEKVIDSPMMNYKVDIRWYATNMIAREKETKRQQKKERDELKKRKEEEEERNKRDQGGDEDVEMKDAESDQEQSGDENNSESGEVEEVEEDEEDEDENEEEDGSEEAGSDRDMDEHSDASNEAHVKSKKSKKKSHSKETKKYSKYRIQVDKNSYHNLRLHPSIVNQNEFMDPQTRTSGPAMAFLRHLNNRFEEVTELETIKEYRNQLALNATKEVDFTSGKEETSIKGTPVLSIQSSTVPFSIFFATNMEKFETVQGLNFIHDRCKSTVRFEGDDVNGYLDKCLNDVDHASATTEEGQKILTMFLSLLHPNSGLFNMSK